MPFADLTGAAARASDRRRQARYRAAGKRLPVLARYEASDQGRASRKASRIARIATGRHAADQAAYKAREREYAEALFHPSPDKRVRVGGVERLVVLSDLQIPFEDPWAVEQALRVIDTVKPDTVVLNGDIVDCYRESAFLQDFRIAERVTDEQHRRARAFMALLKPIKQKIWLGGNHEERWWRTLKQTRQHGAHSAVVQNLLAYINAQREELKLDDPIGSFARLFDMPAHGFTYYPYSHRLYVADDNLVVTHGRYVSRHSGHSARRTFEWLGRSCIVGHTHRLGEYVVTQDGRVRGAWENGCLCQLEPEYDDAPNWQQGFSVVRIRGPEFHVVQVPIVRHTPTSKPVAVYLE